MPKTSTETLEYRTYVRYITDISIAVTELNGKIEELRDAVRQDRSAIRDGLLQTLAAGGAVDRERLRWILKADRAEVWRTEGGRDTVQYLSAEFHISNWKARRWIGAAHALEKLPLTAAALESGSLSLDKVCELARFATPETEKSLVAWARRVRVATVRDRADEALRRSAFEAEDAHHARYLRSQRLSDYVEIEALLPLDQGTALMNVVDELAHELPTHPDTDSSRPGTETVSMEQRRADALVTLVTAGRGRGGPMTDLVLHAPIEALAGDRGGCTLEGGGVLHPETARKLACDARLRVVLEGTKGNALGIGDASRMVPYWLRQQMLHRDHYTCTFPGCEMKRFLHPHHVRHWIRQGPTDLDNLVTVCTFHHDLVHEGRWSVALDASQRAIWFRPGGRVYEPGVAPPELVAIPPLEPLSVAEKQGRLLQWMAFFTPTARDPDDRVHERARDVRKRRLPPDWARTEWLPDD